MTLDYRRILDLYDRIGPQVGTKSVDEFSRYMNREYETDLFSEGVGSNPVRESSVRFTDFLGDSPVGEFASSNIGNLSQMLGFDRSVGEEVGRQLPRSAVDFLPAIGGGVAGFMVGGPPGAVVGAGLGNAASAGMAGWNTYGESGSVPASLISGGVQLAIPAVGRMGSQMVGNMLRPFMNEGIDVLGTQVAKTVQKPITETLAELAGESGLQTLAGELGGIASQTAAMVDRGDYGVGEALGQTLQQYATKENLFQTAVGELPFFVGMDLPPRVLGMGKGVDGETLRTRGQLERNAARQEAIGKVEGLFQQTGFPGDRNQINSYIDEYLGRGENIDTNTFQVAPPSDILALPGPEGYTPNFTSRPSAPTGRVEEEQLTLPDSQGKVLSQNNPIVEVGEIVKTFGQDADSLVAQPVEYFMEQEAAVQKAMSQSLTMRDKFQSLIHKGYSQAEAAARAVRATIMMMPEQKQRELQALMSAPDQMMQFDNLVKRSADVVAAKRGGSFDESENFIASPDDREAFVDANYDRIEEVAQQAYGKAYDDLDPMEREMVVDEIHATAVNEKIQKGMQMMMGLARVVPDERVLDNAMGWTGKKDQRFVTARERVKRLLPFVSGRGEMMKGDDLRLRQLQDEYQAKYGEKPSIETLRKDANRAIKYFNDFYDQLKFEKLYEQLPSEAEQNARQTVEQGIRLALPGPVEQAPSVDQQARVRGEFDEAFQEIQEERPEVASEDIPARNEDTEIDEGVYGFQLLKQMVNSLASRYDTDTESIWEGLQISRFGKDEQIEGQPLESLAAGTFDANDAFTQFYIKLGKAATAETVAHEASHFNLMMIEGLVKQGKGGEQAKADYNELRKFAGLKEGEDFRGYKRSESIQAANEKVTEAFLKYLKDGEAPTPALKRVFENIKQWLREVYGYFQGKLPEELKPVFERWLTTEEGQDNRIASERSRRRQELNRDEQVDEDFSEPLFARRRSPESAQRAKEKALDFITEAQRSVGNTYMSHYISEGLPPAEAATKAAHTMSIVGKINPSPLKYTELTAGQKENMGVFREDQFSRLAGQYFQKQDPSNDYLIMAHEVSHGLQQDIAKGRVDPTVKLAYEKVSRLAEIMSPDARADVLGEVLYALMPDQAHGRAVATARINTDDPHEFVATLLGTFAMGGTTPWKYPAMREALKFLPHEVEDFAKGVYRNMFEYADAIGSQLRDPITRKRFQAMAEQLQSILRVDPESARLDEQMRLMAQADPGTFGAILSSGAVPSLAEKLMLSLGINSRYFTGKNGIGEEPGVLDRNFSAFWQLAQKFPQLRIIEDLGRSFRVQAEQARSKLLSPFATGVSGGKPYVDPEMKVINSVHRNKQANSTFNRIRKKQVELNRPLTEAEMDAELRGLSGNVRNHVAALSRNADNGLKAGADIFRSSSKDRIAVSIATALQGLHATRAKAGGIKIPGADELDALARKFVEAQFDPTLTPQIMPMLAADPEAANVMIEVFNTLKPTYDKLDKTLASNPGYSPESLDGFVITYEDKAGVTQRMHATNSKKHQENLAQAEADPERASPTRVSTNATRKMNNMSGIPSAILEAYNDVERRSYISALNTIKDPAIREQLEKAYVPGDAISQWQAAKSMNKHLLHKKGNRNDVTEFDHLPAILDYLNNLSYFTAKNYVTSRKSFYLNDMALRENPMLVDLANKHLDNVLNPLSKTVGFMNNMNFLYWLGFNPSSAIMDLSQSIFVLNPNLIKKGLGIAQSMRVIGSSAKMALHNWNGKSTGDTMLDKLIKRAYSEGTIDRNATQIFGDDLEHLQHSIYNLGEPGKGLTLGNVMSNAWYYVNKFSKFMYQHTGEFNSKIGFIAGYQAHKRLNPKATEEELYRAGVDMNKESNFSGGAASRPVFADVDTAIGRNARGMLYSLSHYSTSMLGLYLLRSQQAFGKLPLSPHERRQARKALGVMALTQGLAGGAMGLPLVGSVAALVKALTGFDAEEEAKEWAKKNSDDPEGANILATSLLNGAGSFAGPLDVSGRVGLGTVLGVDNYNGLQVTDVMGPTVNLALTMQQSVDRWKQGDLSSGALVSALLPNGVRRVLQAGMDGGAVRGSQGKLVYQPDSVERLALAAGFQPRKLVQQRREANQQRNAANARNSELKRWRNQLADMYDPNNPESASLIQSEVMERRKAELTLDVQNELNQISRLIANRSLPDDPRRLGPKQSTRTAVGVPRMSETDRYLYEKQVESTLNPMSRGPQPRQLQTLQGVDYMIRTYNLSSPQATAAMNLVSSGYPEDLAVQAVQGISQ